eukprot:scaffold331220_cov47-Prasinocladus_malaysianus.AAC.1
MHGHNLGVYGPTYFGHNTNASLAEQLTFTTAAQMLQQQMPALQTAANNSAHGVCSNVHRRRQQLLQERNTWFESHPLSLVLHCSAACTATEVLLLFEHYRANHQGRANPHAGGPATATLGDTPIAPGTLKQLAR